MGLLDYYRQYDDLDEEEFNRGLRERRAREKALALEQIPVLDLSRTEWPDFPNSEIVIFDHTGHCPQLERPVRFNRLLEAFLAR